MANSGTTHCQMSFAADSLNGTPRLPILGELKIPRFDFPVDEVELHKFGDSSLDVFCSVAFLRAQKNAYSRCQLAFVFGKARVAPLKMLSIPK